MTDTNFLSVSVELTYKFVKNWHITTLFSSIIEKKREWNCLLHMWDSTFSRQWRLKSWYSGLWRRTSWLHPEDGGSMVLRNTGGRDWSPLIFRGLSL